MLHTLFVIKVKEFANVLSPFLFYFIFSKICFATFHSFRLQVLFNYYYSFSSVLLAFLCCPRSKKLSDSVSVYCTCSSSLCSPPFASTFFCCLFVFLFLRL